MQAVWWLVWRKLFGPGARAIVEGWTPSGHTRLLSASRLTVAPRHCMHSHHSGRHSATLLRIRALPVPSTGCAYGCHLLRAVHIGRMGICVHSTLWQQARIGMQPDVASGRCVVTACSCACVLQSCALPRGHERQRDRIRRLRATCIAKKTSRSCSLMIIQPKPQYRCGILKHPSSIAKRTLQQAKALRRSEITHFR